MKKEKHIAHSSYIEGLLDVCIASEMALKETTEELHKLPELDRDTLLEHFDSICAYSHTQTLILGHILHQIHHSNVTGEKTDKLQKNIKTIDNNTVKKHDPLFTEINKIIDKKVKSEKRGKNIYG